MGDFNVDLKKRVNLLIIFLILDPFMKHAYMMLSQMSYSIKGWNQDLYNWVFVPNFRIDKFSTSKLKTMLYAKQINIRAKYCTLVDCKMCCHIIFISKEPPPKNFVKYLSLIVSLQKHPFCFNRSFLY